MKKWWWSSWALWLAAGSGAAFALATPPVDFHGFALGSLIGLAVTLFGAAPTGARFEGAGRGLAFGAAANVATLRFVTAVVVSFTPLPWPAALLAHGLLAVAQAVPWMVAAVVTVRLVRARAARPVAFAAGAFAAGLVPAVFPWTPVGGLSAWPIMVQLAEVVGEHGVSALMACCAGLVAIAIVDAHRAPRRAGAAAIAAAVIASATALHGAARMRAVQAESAALPTAKVALVQPAIPAKVRWDPARAAWILEALTALTRRAEAEGAELTVWHETAYPYVVAASSRRCPVGGGAMLGEGVHGPVLTGVLMSAGPHEVLNAAAVCSAGDVLSEPYAKRRLLPFGEAVPLGGVFPWLRRLFVRGTGMIAGTRNVVLEAGPVRASVLNCFEDTLPAAGRDALEGGPNLLVNVTNDAWFAGSFESENHLRMAALRAVEVRRDLVRAVNLGPASWVDATGRVRARADGDTEGTLLVTPTLRESPLTPFVRFGDTPLVVTFGTFAAATLLRAWRRRPPLAAAVTS